MVNSFSHTKQPCDGGDWPLPWDLTSLKRHGFPALIFFILLVLIYGNSFDCSWHFDDYANIVNNPNVHIDNLSWSQVEKSLYGILDSGRWSRPLSYLSFALNYYFHGLDVFGYHVLNLTIHYFATFFLYLFIFNTLNLPVFNGRYQDNAYSIAILGALLWSINPVQVSAVTYIVQRSTSMAALFYILAMYFYLKGRTTDHRGWKRTGLFLSSLLMGLMAIGTKENAAMLPFSIVLFDVMLIQCLTPENVKKNLKLAIFAVLATISVGLLFFGDFASIVGDYSTRPFTAWERLMTQPRVILFYVSLLLYPITSRLTLIHDFEISRTLIDPWMTAVSISIVFVLLMFAFLKARKWPLFAYCVLFFFLNHAIEGSFISLELVFEHRNYLPSMLLFVPVSVFIVSGLDQYVNRPGLRIFLALSVAGLIMLQGVTVFIENIKWKNEISLWQDNVKKAPRVHHARQNLATAYIIAGRHTEAFEELQKALSSYASADVTKISRTYGLMGEYFFLRGEDDKALWHCRESLKMNPKFHQSYHKIAEILLRKNQSLIAAESSIVKALSLNSRTSAYHLTYAEILLKKGLSEVAKQEAKAALMLDPDSPDPYKIMAKILKQKGEVRAAEHFSKVALTKERLMIR